LIITARHYASEVYIVTLCLPFCFSVISSDCTIMAKSTSKIMHTSGNITYINYSMFTHEMEVAHGL